MALMGPEEQRVVIEESTWVGVHPPRVPPWVQSTVADYAARVGRTYWLTALREVGDFAQKMRRTEEELARTHGTDRGTVRWWSIAWEQYKGYVPQDLNRTDKHGHEIPYWVSGMLWDLQGDKPAAPWHRAAHQ